MKQHQRGEEIMMSVEANGDINYHLDMVMV